MCVLYDYWYGIFVCKCVSVSECKLCYIIYVVVQSAKRKTAVAILVLAPGGDEIARVDDFDMPEHHSHGP